ATNLKRSGRVSGQTARKVVHIGVGLIVILIPLIFSSKILPIIIGLSFVVITYITSPASPFPNLKMSAFRDGHGYGTVFYSLSLTTLLFLYFEEGWIIQVGFLPLVVGDGFASLIGIKYGSHKWKLVPNKSLEGSSAGFIATFILLILTLSFYKLIDEFAYHYDDILLIAALASISMVIMELISPFGFDNLTIPFACTLVALYAV
ncbi:MAG: diacylglycerol/polyprenol kinase family protein, partial [Candidatus Kariarchaeaceae archaeon]